MTKKLLFLSLFLIPFLVFAQSFKGFDDPTHYVYKPHLHDDDQKAPSNVFFADFNGDGHQDFVIDGAIFGQSLTGDYMPNASFLSLIQDTSLNFSQKNHTLGKVNDQYVYVKWWQLEDYNQDGFMDLILPEVNHQKVNTGNGDSSVYIWLGNANADYDLSKTPDFELKIKRAASRLYFVDLNDDGKRDIIYHEAYNTNIPEYKEVIVLLKKHTNNYIENQKLTHETSLLENFKLNGGLGLSDLNRDNSPDLVVIRDGFVQVFLNKEGTPIDDDPVAEQQKPLKIYPNPTRDILNIDSGHSENKIKQL
ncbi:MAG: FG-GAP repeat domain-containing protein, partial [Flavobacteriaceae bacterium]